MRTDRFPNYPFPWATAGQILYAALRVPGERGHRSFREDAQACVSRLRPALRVYGREHVPRSGPVLLTVNHYSRPGFQAWWLALAISAVVPADVHWIMTAAWTYADPLRARTLAPLTQRLFARIARVYRFTATPPMPPHPRDVVARAAVVRRVLVYARQTPQPLVGLAPEGGDSPDGVLQWPPPGAGRFMLHLARLGLDLVPVGGFESEGAFCLRFGPAYRLDGPSGLPAADLDREASRTVMRRIAAQLPAHLNGEFA